MPSWLEPPNPQDMVFKDESLYDILMSRKHFSRGHQPLAVIDDQYQIHSVVCLSDILAYVAVQMQEVHHLWPSLTAVVPKTSWRTMRTSVLGMPIGQFSRSRRGLVWMPTDWAHAVRCLSRSSRSVLYVQDRRHALVGKITWISLQRYRNFMGNYEEDDRS